VKKLNIRNWSRRKKIIALLILVLVAGGLFYLFTKGSAEEIVEEVTEPNKKYYSQLTGLEVPEEESERPVLGVMIENSEEARPQSGLDSAGIVFETVTEAGITRYLLLFQENQPEEVGPVRSVRPAFVDWAMGFDASIAHVGGSEQALKMIEDRDYPKDMNEFAHSDAYYRRPDKEAPHDAYAKTATLRELQEELEHEPSVFDEIMRTDETPANPPTVSTIALQFSHPIFGVSFTYDPAINSYARNLGGVPHIDANTGKQITVKNLIVFKQDVQGGALGSGEATLYRDGGSESIKWEQDSYDERIKFIDATGNDVALNRGDTWIAVLPLSGTVTNQ
jgi:hypothetical protein